MGDRNLSPGLDQGGVPHKSSLNNTEIPKISHVYGKEKQENLFVSTLTITLAWHTLTLTYICSKRPYHLCGPKFRSLKM